MARANAAAKLMSRRGRRKAVAEAKFQMADAAPEGLQSIFSGAVDLETFRARASQLTLSQRRLIVEQALVLIEQNYVHLPHKAAMHAVNPVQRLRLMRARLSRPSQGAVLAPAAAFHGEMAEIFHSMRDLHTNYLLPPPYAGQVAFLPFLVEEYFEGGRAKYLVTRVMQGFDSGRLGRGTEITHWNGMPIARAIEVNAARYAGSNEAARHARGVESLTIRPLRVHRYPDEDWVVIGYQHGGQPGELRQPWLVAANLPPLAADDDDLGDARTALGFDYDLDEANRARKLLFAPAVAASELEGAAAPLSGAAGEVPSRMPSVFRARRVQAGPEEFGHLRIFTFNVADPDGFVAEFVRLMEALPQDGLIVDVRGNGGGHIWAAECALQTLTPKTIVPQPTQFINTTLNAELCRQHDRGQGGIDLGPWLPSIEQSVETGAPYSNAYSITPAERANAIGQRYFGPVVLITDGRCYSATDIFAAGFQDHGIGRVLGVDANTGAGGANVWTHGLLSQLVQSGTAPSPYRPLPVGVDMRVSIRRMLRVGPAAGTPVEDLGVVPDELHQMTRLDIEGGNDDLMGRAASILAAQPPRRLDVTGTIGADGKLTLSLTTAGMDRLDVFLDGRPAVSVDVAPGAATIVVAAAGARRLVLAGYAGGRLVANRRESLGPLPSGDWGIQHGAALVRAPALDVPENVRLLVAAGDADRETVEGAVRAAFGPGWEVEPLFAGEGETPASLAGYFSVSGNLRSGSADERRARAFEMSRLLMGLTGYDVQPDLPSAAMNPPAGEYNLDDDPAEVGSGSSSPLPGTEAADWALKKLRVPEAWTAAPGKGAGIVVGHPDTGFTVHPELGAALDLAKDRDIVDNDDNATDPLTKRWWWKDNPGHGTATASVIVSRNPGGVTGSAPGASLVPIRAIQSVVLVFDGNVAKAVEHARKQGCHVISMSLGGVGFSPALRAAINAAIDDGVIVLAAAGNQVGFVVSPANYSEVVAVAATNIQDKPWDGSSHGSAVDVAAPGESVHAARAKKGSSGPEFSVARSSGTSFAVAQTAGIAALWLEKHGRAALIAKYGKGNLQAVFADLVRKSSRQPAGWDSSEYGDGIVNAEDLLARPLPAVAPALARGATLSAEARLACYFPDQSTASARAALDAVLAGVDDRDRDAYAGELAYYMSQNPEVRAAMVTAGRAGSLAGAGSGTALALAELKSLASPSLAAAMR